MLRRRRRSAHPHTPPPHTHTHRVAPRSFKARHGTKFALLPEKAAFQLNDTHPTIAVAELMRLLVDVEGLDWEEAWGITTKVRV